MMFPNHQIGTGSQNTEEMYRAIADLETRINNLENGNKITNDMPFEDKDSLMEIIGDRLLDVLWNHVYYNSSFAAESVTTSSSTEDITAREIDTSAGKKFLPSLDSRFRLNFYINSGQSNITAYILSPAISTDSTFSTSVPIATNTYLSYVGIKIILGRVYLVSSIDGYETTKITDKTITDSTTHTVEIQYRAGEAADIYYDNEFLGSISAKMQKGETIYTYYPYLTSVKSASGSVNLTIENYEFAQVKSTI